MVSCWIRTDYSSARRQVW